MEQKEGIEIFFAVSLVIILLLTGSSAYMYFEGWSFVDALYFSTSTLSTTGLGDLVPTSQESRLFTVFFILFGISLLFYAFSLIASNFLARQQPKLDEGLHNFIHGLKREHDEKHFKPPKKVSDSLPDSSEKFKY